VRLKNRPVERSGTERGCNDLLRDFVFTKDLSGRKKENYNNKPLAFRSKPTNHNLKLYAQ